ncbi:hypothetical protein MGG_16191 [Pyricularia oryzae 70-15]|uniref:Uncharacterized protein n=1 Tax=Pyricularia oryzae (strain 70-15 / ATCC MYA-4617 / FGSC 8958) TaxID=242507 RepID=G4MMI9_PYRO7|nr:uncharacterized protein MGG_16191 [Pyricularia oryzae 70-15]EHA56967.1 hypothetical protein MGG_16191 [Pyricularia oryzae 70-15]
MAAPNVQGRVILSGADREEFPASTQRCEVLLPSDSKEIQFIRRLVKPKLLHPG